MMALRYVVTFLALSLLLSACRECGPAGEPNLFLNFTSAVPVKIDSVYASGATREIPLTFSTLSDAFTLPINLNADSTRYVFRLNGRQESITVYYQRYFSYKDAGCGYIINLGEPLSRSNRVHTTVGAVDKLEYVPNFLSTTINRGWDTHIRLLIHL